MRAWKRCPSSRALRVSVRDLFAVIDDAALSNRVASLQERTDEQQVARDRISGGWRWLYIGLVVVLALFSFTVAQGLMQGVAPFFAYSIVGYIVLVAVRRIYLEPHLDQKYPLSRRKRPRRTRRQKPEVA